jgi:hypothetical protein
MRLRYPLPAFLGLLALSTGLTYWRCAAFPFFQDDWGWLYKFSAAGPASVIRSILSFKGTLFYRPLPQLYMLAMYHLFGPNPAPFHVAALSIHFLNAVLVAFIIRKITNNGRIAYVASLLYALSISVNLDPLLWMVGSYELLCAFFFFLSFLLYLHGKLFLSVASFACSIISKESSFMLPAIFLSYRLIYRTQSEDREEGPYGRGEVAAGILFALIMALSLLPKVVSGIFYVNFPSTHPYLMKPLGAHVLINLYAYPAWMLRTFLPFFTIRQPAFVAFFVLVAVYLVLCLKNVLLKAKDKDIAAHLLFFFLWAGLALAPAIPLVNHRFSYYSVYALPAFLALVIMLFENGSGTKTIRLDIVAVCVVIAVAGASIYQSGEIFRHRRQDTVRRALAADEVRRDLMRRLPALPHGSVLIFDGVDTEAFANEYGPRFWYRDRSIDVYKLDKIESDGKGIYVLDVSDESEKVTLLGGQYRKRYIEPAKAYVLRLAGNGLALVDIRSVFPILPKDSR